MEILLNLLIHRLDNKKYKLKSSGSHSFASKLFYWPVVSKMKSIINGYSVAARLCEYSTLAGTGLSFPNLCKVFGPLCWENLLPLEKLYFKRVAIQYKQTAMGIAERAGTLPTREEYLDAIFGERTGEQDQVLDKLETVVIELYNMTFDQIQDMADSL